MKDNGPDSHAQNTRQHGAAGSPVRDVQRAEVSLMVTKHSGLRAEAEITNGGLLAVAVLVSSILLSTAVLVHVAVSAQRRRR